MQGHASELPSFVERRSAHAAYHNTSSRKLTEGGSSVIRNHHLSPARLGLHFQAGSMVFDDDGKHGAAHLHPSTVICARCEILERNFRWPRQHSGTKDADLWVLYHRSELARAADTDDLDILSLL